MFRYIAIAWNESEPARATAAQHLSAEWRHRSGWDAALVRPGLEVFTRDTDARVNDVVRLQDGSGLILGRLFRRADPTLQTVPHALLSGRDAENIFRSGGRALVSDFWGRYVAFLKTAHGSTLLLRDPTGALPCFRLQHRGVSIIFSWLEDALLMLGEPPPLKVNWDAVTAQLMRGSLGGRETSLDGVLQVLPGEMIDLHDESSTLLWSAVEIAGNPSICNVEDACALLRHTVQVAARAWASCYSTLLLRLSGGIDSSILLSCLDPSKAPADVICLNYHSPGSDSDERHYARLAAARTGRDLLERERDPGFRIERILEAARMPDPVFYVGRMNAHTDAALAASYAAPALFTGAGGDAVFYEMLQWWPAADYLHIHGLDAGFPASAMDAARLGRVSVWRAIASALSEWFRHDALARRPGGTGPLLTPDVQQYSVDLDRFAHPAFRGADQLPIGKFMQTVALMHPVGYYDPFEKEAAPEIVHPLLSQPLVELALRLPTYLLIRGGHGRALARQAFASELPPQISNRRTKGGMEDHLRTVLHSNLDFVRGILLEGQLARRGMLDRAKLEELLSDRPTALIGSMSQIHGLVAVEAWLSRWTH